MGSFGKTFQFEKGEGRKEQDLVNTKHVGAVVLVFQLKNWQSEIDLYTGVL
jgi:hypothetical protein